MSANNSARGAAMTIPRSKVGIRREASAYRMIRRSAQLSELAQRGEQAEVLVDLVEAPRERRPPRGRVTSQRRRRRIVPGARDLVGEDGRLTREDSRETTEHCERH